MGHSRTARKGRPPGADTRKDETKLTDAEWQALIDAINQLHGVGAA
jgi:hypothetical protein